VTALPLPTFQSAKVPAAPVASTVTVSPEIGDTVPPETAAVRLRS
jgi:hypothetical protein